MAQIGCKYHQDVPAAWVCLKCQINYCGNCVPAEERAVAPNCPVCKQPLEHLGAGNLITPFWQKTSSFYKYPASIQPAMFILAIAFLNSLVGLIIPPFEFLVPILSFIVFVRYAYLSLEQTAHGHMSAPTVSVGSLTEDVELPFKQLFLIFILITVNMLIREFIGEIAFGISATLSVLLFPACIMVMATAHSFGSALNPVVLARFIKRIGWPYLILCAFLFLLLLALETTLFLLSRIIPEFFITFIISLITMYFLLIMFHMMGYVIYQFHEDLEHDVDVEPQEHLDTGINESSAGSSVVLANLEILLSEGKLEEAKKMLLEHISDSPGDLEARDRYHRLLRAQKEGDACCRHANEYLSRLLREKRATKAVEVFLDCLKLNPNWQPAEPRLRISLARLFRQGTNAKIALKLLNQFHHDFPNHEAVPEAYLLAAQVMCESYGEDAKAQRVLKYVLHHFPGAPLEKEVQQYLAIVQKLSAN